MDHTPKPDISQELLSQSFPTGKCGSMALRHMNWVPLPGALPGPQLIRQADVHGGSAWARWAMQESQPGIGHLLLPHASLRPEIML